jgi:hypothetical protein
MEITKLYSILKFEENESHLYMPNEIFSDLKVIHNKGSSHIAFCYSYYYLISWLYRYCKYGQLDIDVKMIKDILGYNSTYKKLDYLIKKNGIIDEIGYTSSSTDFPYSWDFNDGDIEFNMFSELDTEVRKVILKRKGKNSKIKLPTKGLWRSDESEEDGHYDGTFYNVSRTHLVKFEVFVKCMGNKDLGCIGFYLYGYLKLKCQWYQGDYKKSIDKIAEETGLSTNTTEKYLSLLEIHKLIEHEENLKWFYHEGKIIREAHTYKLEL